MNKNYYWVFIVFVFVVFFAPFAFVFLVIIPDLPDDAGLGVLSLLVVTAFISIFAASTLLIFGNLVERRNLTVQDRKILKSKDTSNQLVGLVTIILFIAVPFLVGLIGKIWK